MASSGVLKATAEREEKQKLEDKRRSMKTLKGNTQTRRGYLKKKTKKEVKDKETLKKMK